MNSLNYCETTHGRTNTCKRSMLAIRKAIIGWWKRKRSFYVKLQQQKDSSSTEQQLEIDHDNRIGVMKLIVDWTVDDDSSNNLNSNEDMNSDGSISSSSSSQFDITSISSNNEHPHLGEQQPPLLNSLQYSSDDDDSHGAQVLTPIISQPKTCHQYLVSHDVVLTRTFPFTPHQSYSAASIVSIDSMSASNCWDLDDNDNSLNERNTDINGHEPHRFFSTSTSTTDETDTNSSYGQHDLFKHHVQFLENRTQAQQVREYDAYQHHSRSYIPYPRSNSKQ